MASNHSRTRSAFAANAALPQETLERTASASDRRSRSRRRATVSGAPDQKLTWGLPAGDGASTPKSRADPVSREASTVNLALVAQLLTENKLDTDTYGVTESRDGFFDAFFLHPPSVEYADLLESVEPTLPKKFRAKGPFSPRKFVKRQWDGVKAIAVEVFTTRSGLLLFKSFLAFYIAYVLCLVPVVSEWLGRYNYIMAVSTIVNHPGRTVGSQIDGAVLTTIGTAAGLGWGAAGLALSTSTSDAQTGFAGVLALFLALFMAFIAFMRSYFIRLYQLVFCGGMAITYTCLAEVDGQQVKWSKIYGYAIPWMLGQAIALTVCLIVYPDAGARPLAEVFHRAFGVMLDGLVIPRPRSQEMRQRLSQAFFDLSVAHRDMKLDITIARFRARDIKELRGHMQGVIRGLLSLKIDNELFEGLLHSRPTTRRSGLSAISEKSVDGRPGNPRASTWAPSLSDDDAQAKGLHILQGPTQGLVEAVEDGLRACDAALMDMSGYRSYLGPPKDVSSDVAAAENRIATAVEEFDDAEGVLSGSQETQGYNPEIIRLLVLARSVRMTTDPIIKLMARMREMKAQSNHIRVDPPAYAFWKSLNRSNAQVRHDRGTVTPSSYSQTFARISELVNRIKAREHHPIIDDFGEESDLDDTESVTKAVEPSQRLDSVRHRTWRALRRLQGFEGKFALRVVVMTGVLSAPGYVQASRGWWNQHDAWWAVCMGWVMSHTMVGGSLADLVVRSSIVVMSALWSGFAYAARDGNPIVMAAFALLYMLPMMYRFTRSSHPRSGLAGCLSFTVISLGLSSSGGASPPAAVRGLAFLVGVVAATIVNWVLWPFIARHQLRKSVSSMLFFLSVIYRDMVTKYVYYEHAHPPTPTDVQQSESLESHLREGFIRIRQLLYLTPHELRLRAPFDAVPYVALIDACEAFFDDLITVRQAALFYAADFARRGEAARIMLGHRRDAVASVLTNLYVLSGALRAGTKVPRYLPSAAVSRKRLLDRMAEVEADAPEAPDPDERSREKWALIYRYSYNESLTRCVAHLEAMERWTKLILGERSFDDAFMERDDED